MNYIEGWYDNHPSLEYDRRGLSGVYIFDKFPGEDKVQPTCFEDCSTIKQEEYIKALDPQALQRLTLMLARALKDVGKDLNIESDDSQEDFIEDNLLGEEDEEIPQG